MKIRNKVTAAALLGIIPFLAGMAVIVRAGRASDRVKTADLMAEYAQSIAGGLEAFFSDARYAARTAAFLRAGFMPEWNSGGREFLEDMLSLFPSVNAMAIVNADGSFHRTGIAGNAWQGGIATENDIVPNSTPLTLADRAYFRPLVSENARGEPLVIVNEPYLPLGSINKEFLTSAAVIRDGRPAGIINAAQTSWDLLQLYNSLTANFIDRFGTGARMYLFSEGGQLISLLEYNADQRAYTDNVFGLREIISIDTLDAETVSAVYAALASDSGAITASIGGEPFYLSGFEIAGTPFAVCLAVPRSYVLATSRSMLNTGVAMLLIVVAVMGAGMFFVTKAMLKSLKAVDSTMQEIAAGGGDLTVRLEGRGKDEIASICRHFNLFISTLNSMLSKVSESASSMASMGLALSNNVYDISGRAASIARATQEMNFAADEQSASVTETSGTIAEIAQNIESLSGQIESQSAAVTESSAAVQQMVSNINSISQNVSRASSSFGALKSDTDDGKASITHVQELVNRLYSQSDSLLEANSVIDSIAGQTNLLALNAAIEAAHAGDAGKGFSVVAEEIRSLAEDAAEQSKAIDRVLKDAVSSIRNIAKAANDADSSFDSVVARIDSAVALVSEINFSMAEQIAGSRQVLEGLTGIEGVTMQIRDGAVEMNAGAAAILKEMGRLASVSQQLQEMAASIAEAANAINGAVEKIVQSSGSNASAISALVSMTSKFTL